MRPVWSDKKAGVSLDLVGAIRNHVDVNDMGECHWKFSNDMVQGTCMVSGEVEVSDLLK